MIARIFLACLLIATPVVAKEKLQVVASFSILADMAREIGGEDAEVFSLVAANMDAHSFEPAPADSAKFSKAQLIIMNGLGFEGWMDRLVRASSARGELVVASDGIQPIAAMAHEEDGQDQHGHDDHGHDHHEGGLDPHAWQDASNGVIYARNIADGFCKVDAENCAAYQVRARDYAQRIQALDEKIKARFAAIPQANRRIILSHDAFGYFCKANQITCLAAQGITDDSEPSAKDIAALITEARQEKVRALFLENVSDPRLLEQIGRETGLVTSGILYSDALSREDGPVPNYLSLLEHNANMIAQALEAP